MHVLKIVAFSGSTSLYKKKVFIKKKYIYIYIYIYISSKSKERFEELKAIHFDSKLLKVSVIKNDFSVLRTLAEFPRNCLLFFFVFFFCR